ncbi:cutinase family protein [Mycobacterium sp. ITM-2016-00318]|uniref:cutinase family protein n=1 Tax=Mycobacterium sp. ITM-2016-00318 TaxID=2099693 RepID=UPI001E3E7E22|nr:cutinase family protein [Mycobacterium sp. ITM-2016-00318]WNG93819.1 cutinase family protein [Mycobacterium sp. ITM-2016-00318]
MNVAACAVAVAGSALVGFASGTANAAPGCPDVHWMGAAGSGERTPYEVGQNEGMGAIVYQSYQALSSQLAQEGRTITAEAVNYPAEDVPDDAGVGDWLEYMGSVDAGTAALGAQYADFTARCPESKVVLAGYSQGAMVVHRNLVTIGANPNMAAALLIADGDRHPDDTTVNIGTASTDPEKTGGAAQDWPILAHAPAILPANIGVRTISVCDAGDAVCDYDPEVEEASPAAVAIHTSYTTADSDGQLWTFMVKQLLGSSSETPAPQAPEGATSLS